MHRIDLAPRPLYRSNEGRKKHPRLRIEAALKEAADTGLTRHEMAERTGCSVTLINDTIRTMLRANECHHDDSKPAKFFAGPSPDAGRAVDVVPPRAINFWALPVYVPPKWHVREGAGRVVS